MTRPDAITTVRTATGTQPASREMADWAGPTGTGRRLAGQARLAEEARVRAPRQLPGPEGEHRRERDRAARSPAPVEGLDDRAEHDRVQRLPLGRLRPPQQ